MTTTVENPSPTPVSIGAPRGGPDQPTLRKDNWWVEPAVTFVVLVSFVVYSTWAAFVGKNYYAGADLHRNLISPFYSPCIANSCVPGSHAFGTLPFWNYSPALLILIFPLGFRLTCYYYRKAYYRSFWLSPPACGVADAHAQLQRRDPVPPDPAERPPLLLLDPAPLQLHPHLRRHPRLPPARLGIGISVGTLVLCANAAFLWLYSLSCHACRHFCGGQVKSLRQAPDALQALEVRHPAQRAPHALRLDQPLRCRPLRPLRPPGGERDDPRPRLSLLGLDREDPHGRSTHDYETYDYDVIIIGAGGAGLRAAIEAKERGPPRRRSSASRCSARRTPSWPRAAWRPPWATSGPRTTGRSTSATPCAAARCSTTGAWREIHAQEAPDRVYELERWGALFDRTKDGRITQRDFGGHRYARLAHVGDRTGLELIRTLQQKVVSMGTDVFMECKILRLLPDAEGRISGAVGYMAPDRRDGALHAPRPSSSPPGRSASRGSTRPTRGSATGDGHAMALWAGADVIDMECVQFHPTGMVWPLSVRGILVTEGVRGDGGVLRNSEGNRFMFNYVADMFRAETAETEEEADRWYEDHNNNRRPPDLLPRDEVARAINSEVKAGRGSPHGGVFLDIASRRTPEYIRRRLPSMYHQFMELAGVDITAEPMEVGPTCHYIMGGVRVDADTAGGRRARASSPPARWRAACTAPTASAATPCPTSSSSAAGPASAPPTIAEGRAGTPKRRRGGGRRGDRRGARALRARGRARTPTTVHHELQETMQALVGIIRTGPELEEALPSWRSSSEQTAKLTVKGGRAYNPGWNLATDLPP